MNRHERRAAKAMGHEVAEAPKPTIVVTLKESEVMIVNSLMNFGGIIWDAYAEKTVEPTPEDPFAGMPEDEIKSRSILFFLTAILGVQPIVDPSTWLTEIIEVRAIDDRLMTKSIPRVTRPAATTSGLVTPNGSPLG